MSGHRLHRHESGAEEVFCIEQRVDGRHERVDHAVVAEHLHILLCGERLLNLGLRCPGLLHLVVAVGLLHGLVDKGCELSRRQFLAVGGIGCTLHSFFLAEETWLECLSEMLGDSLFGIALHARVDCGVNLEAVGVDVVSCSVGFWIFLNPSVEGVGLPCD